MKKETPLFYYIRVCPKISCERNLMKSKTFSFAPVRAWAGGQKLVGWRRGIWI
jgi:hypothetical protein